MHDTLKSLPSKSLQHNNLMFLMFTIMSRFFLTFLKHSSVVSQRSVVHIDYDIVWLRISSLTVFKMVLLKNYPMVFDSFLTVCRENVQNMLM